MVIIIVIYHIDEVNLGGSQMSEDMEYNPDIYTLVDEEGVEQTFELLDVLEIEDQRYFALVPYFESPDDVIEDDGDLIVLRSELDENGEELMVSIDDEEEYQRIGNIFLDKLAEMFSEEIDN